MNLSIITVNLNNDKGLEKTLQSVSSQSYDSLEHIIIDGASTDGSIEILRQSKSPKLNFISEKDKGIYNAMNKGIKMSLGRYCLFLNAGDYLINDTILTRVFSNDFDEDIVYGDIYFKEKSNLVPGTCVPDKPTLQYLLQSIIPHPASFIKRSLLNSSGGYNEEYIIVSDWEFILKSLIFNKASYRKIPFFISVFDKNGISSNPQNQSLILEERKKVLLSLLPEAIINQFEEYEKEVKEFRKLKKNFFLRKLFRIMK